MAIKKIKIGSTEHELQTTISNVDGLQAALDNKAAYSHGTYFLSKDSFTTTAGNGTSGSYLSTKWSVAGVDGITTPFDGMKIAVRVPAVGVSTAGIVLSINGTSGTYYPVVRLLNTAITTHYAVNSTMILTFNASQTATAYLTSNTKTTVTGCWQIGDYDSNTKTTTGTSNKTGTKLYLAGATSQSSSGATTYSNSNCYIGTDNCLYSGGSKVATELAEFNLDTLGVPELTTGGPGEEKVTALSVGSGVADIIEELYYKGAVRAIYESQRYVLNAEYCSAPDTLATAIVRAKTNNGAREFTMKFYVDHDYSIEQITTCWTYLSPTALYYISGLTDDINYLLSTKSDSSHTHSSYVNQNAFSNVTVGSTTIAADSTTDTLTLAAGSNITLTPDATNDKVTIAATDTTYSAGTGISLSGTTFSNSGVRSIATGSTNGTISVNTNGTSAEVAVKGLGTAAYTASTAYAAASHNQSASTITSGTLAVARGGTGVTSHTDTTYTTARYRASALTSTATNPTVNGVINWWYE